MGDGGPSNHAKSPALGGTRHRFLGPRTPDEEVPITTPRDGTTIGFLKAQLIERQMELSQLRQVYREGTSRVRQAEASVQKLRRRIEMEVAAQAANETTLLALERDLRATETVYLELRKKLNQIDLFLDMNRRQVQSRIVIEPALTPRGSEWKRKVAIGVLGALASLVLGLGLAGYREYVDHSLQTEDDVKRYLGMEVLATIPEVRHGELRVATDPLPLISQDG